MSENNLELIRLQDKLLVCHRRLFEADGLRFFVGEVLAFNGTVVKLRGYSFVRDLSTGKFLRKTEPRTKIISVIAGTHLLYELPKEVSLDDLQVISTVGLLMLSDDSGFQMDLTEHAHEGQI